jgi:methylene-tetrahydromethanopterin dehydrogenase
MVAKVEKALEKKFERGLKDTRIAVFGATGVVGFCTAVIAAKEGAKVTIIGHDGVERVQKVADEIKARFGAGVEAEDGSTESKKTALAEKAEVILTAAKAGVQVISKAQLSAAGKLLIASDVNAVPPAGIEGLAVNANSDPLEGTKAVGIGPLAVGNVKYKVEFGLFKRMIEAEKTVTFDFQDAFSFAREIAK